MKAAPPFTAGESSADDPVVVERPDGSRIQMVVNIRPLRDPDGIIVGAMNCFYEMAHPIAIPPSSMAPAA